MTKETFYITTPIYYPSDKLHIGHSYTTVAADAMARYKRLRGYDVMFLTGTDEHGQKIQRKAQENGVSSQEYVDHIVAGIKELWQLLDISYDRFIRTTDEHHKAAIQTIFQRLYDKGDIYKSVYEGWYCTPCESFWTETQLKEGRCPDCGQEVEKTSEDSYFFRLSKYQDALINLFENNPEFIQPASRANEMLNNFLRPGLEDLCVSRTTFDWGVQVPFDPKHVVYVWIDALSNYITALGYPQKSADMAKYWPADVHLVGKEIVRFHTIIWPAMLMALDLPLPKQVYGHGWLLFKDGKMSKSKGNVIDPVVLCERYGVDAIRYFLLREVPFGSDGNFSNEALISRINSDLANDLGNLASRTIAMIEKNFPDGLPEQKEAAAIDQELVSLLTALPAQVEQAMEKLQFSLALSEIWRMVGRSNKYIDETQPWILARNEEDKSRLAAVLFNLADVLRVVSILLEPFLPATSKKLQLALGLTDQSILTWQASYQTGLYKAKAVTKGTPLFPRLDMAKEIKSLEALLTQATLSEEELKDNSSQGKSFDAVDDKEGKHKVEKTKEETPEGVTLIEFEDFLKLELKVGTITNCEKVEKADKLLCSQIDMGTHTRQVVSGIAQSYQPEELIGQQVIVVSNLKARKIRGLESHGMILCATDKDQYRIITVDKNVANGAEVS